VIDPLRLESILELNSNLFFTYYDISMYIYETSIQNNGKGRKILANCGDVNNSAYF